MSDTIDDEKTAEELKRDSVKWGAKKTVRTTREEFTGEEQDPEVDEHTLSKPEREAVKRADDMTFDELVEHIGKIGYEEWRIVLYRKQPIRFRGRDMTLGRIGSVSKGLSINRADLEAHLKEKYGGGVYTVRVYDKRGCRKYDDIEIEGDPVVDGDGHGAGKISQLEEDIKAEELQQRLDEVKSKYRGGGSGDNTLILVETLRGIMETSSSNMRVMMDQASQMRREEAEARREALQRELEMKREEERLRREHEEKMEKLRLDSDSGQKRTSVLETLIPAMTPVVAVLVQNMSNKSKEERERYESMMNLILQATQAGQGNTDMYRIMIDAMSSKTDAMAAMFVEIMHLMSGDDDDPKLKMWKMFMDTLNDGMDIVKSGIETKKLLGTKLIEIGAGQQQAAAQQQGAPSQAGPQQNIQQLDPEATMEKYEAMPVEERITELFRCMIIEAPLKPHPTESVTCLIACSDGTPEIFVKWITESGNIADLRERVYLHINEKVITDIIDNAIFVHDDRTKWLDGCVRYMRDYYLDEGEEEDTEEETATPADEFDGDGDEMTAEPGEATDAGPAAPEQDTAKDKKPRGKKK